MEVCAAGDPLSLYDLGGCVGWIRRNHFETVCAQFSDDCIAHATDVADRLAKETGVQVYIAADNQYSGCCVDQVVARQAGVACIVHFGDCCSTPASEGLPIFIIQLRDHLDIAALRASLERWSSDNGNEQFKCDVVIMDQRYAHMAERVQQEIPDCRCVVVVNSDLLLEPGCRALYLGKESCRLSLLLLKNPTASVYSWNNDTKVVRREDGRVNVQLRRRLRLIQKAQEASIVGILIGNSNIRDCVEVERRLRRVAKAAGKKAYALSIKKVTPCKLANFPEIQLFVYIGCPYSALIDCSDFYRPLISPYEFDLACSSPDDSIACLWNPVSGLLSNFVTSSSSGTKGLKDDIREVACRQEAAAEQQLHNETSDFFQQRSWKGLDDSTFETVSPALVRGLSGLAVQYDTEPK